MKIVENLLQNVDQLYAFEYSLGIGVCQLDSIFKISIFNLTYTS